MSNAFELACCVPVLLLWLGPVAFVAFCGLFGGCGWLARKLRPRLHA